MLRHWSSIPCAALQVLVSYRLIVVLVFSRTQLFISSHTIIFSKYLLSTLKQEWSCRDTLRFCLTNPTSKLESRAWKTQGFRSLHLLSKQKQWNPIQASPAFPSCLGHITTKVILSLCYTFSYSGSKEITCMFPTQRPDGLNEINVIESFQFLWRMMP